MLVNMYPDKEIDSSWNCPICSISLGTFRTIYPKRRPIVNHHCHTREDFFWYFKSHGYIDLEDIETRWALRKVLGRFRSLDICETCNIMESRLKLRQSTKHIVPTSFSFSPDEMTKFICFDGQKHMMDEAIAYEIYCSISESWLDTAVSRSLSEAAKILPELVNKSVEDLVKIGVGMKREVLLSSPQMYGVYAKHQET